MIEFEGARAKNIVYFKNAFAQLNVNPLTFVRGSNLDADPATPTGNGAGKSLFFSIIPTVAYASPPTSTKKKAKKEILGKGSENDISVKGADGHHYRIQQTSTKYVIHKDGEDIKIRTTPLAEDYIRTNIFPLAEIEYYTHGFISTLRPYLMRSDTDANRLDHFSNIFRLNSYDDLKAHFSKQFRSVKDNEVRMSVLEQKAVSLRDKLKKVRKSVSNHDLEKARAEHKEMDKLIQKLVQKEFNLSKNQQVLKTLQSIEKELDELRAKYTYKDHPAKRLEILKMQKALAKKWDSYNSLLKAYKKNIETTESKLKEIELPSKDRKKLEAELTLVKERLVEAEERVEAAEEARDNYNRLVKKAKPIAAELEEHGIGKSDKVDLKKDYDPEIDSLRTQLRLKKLIDHDHGDGNSCPTCMSEIDVKNIKRMVAAAQKKLPELEKAQRAQELFREIKELRSKIAEIKFDPEDFERLEKQRAAFANDVEIRREAIKVWKRHDELKAILDDIEKPAPPKNKLEVKMTYDELDEEIDLCTEILSHVQSKEKLLTNNPELSEYKSVKTVKAKIVETGKLHEEVSNELSEKRKLMGEISNVIEQQAALKSEFDLYTKENKEVTEEIAKLKPSIEDKKILEVLLKAYSSKGLKVLVANQICEVLETNLNHYRHLIFSEPFTFSIHASETGLSIKVDRGNDIVSDVRNLSGAESNCFSLLFLLSILPLIPEERRLNMVVLDEPSAHMDAVTRQIFVERYLPALMEVVPHIYVITPNDEYINGSSEWVVRKEHGIATLITEPHRDIDSLKEDASEAVAKAIAKAKKTSTKATKSKGKSKASA